MMRGTDVLLPLLLLLAPTSAEAREGLFLRLGLGPGLAVETGAINGAGLALAAKDHAIGWGITDKFAVQLAECGALVRRRVGEFDYLNLDGFVLGGTVFLPHSALVSVAAGYGQVAFAHNWWEATGTKKDEGLAVNAVARREWYFARRWALGLGAQAAFFRTFRMDYTFFNFSVVGSVTFYLTPTY